MYLATTLDGFTAPTGLLKRPSGSPAARPAAKPAAIISAAAPLLPAVAAPLIPAVASIVPSFADSSYGSGGSGASGSSPGGVDLNSIIGTVGNVIRDVIRPAPSAAGIGTPIVPGSPVSPSVFRAPSGTAGVPARLGATTQPSGSSAGGIPMPVIYGGLALLAIVLLTRKS